MKPVFFKNQVKFRNWLQKHHKKETQLLVGFYKVGSGKASITWSESVDQALCFGWIDGVRKSIDAESYSIRFTPRKPASIWSNINIKKVNALMEQNELQPAGLEAFNNRVKEKSGIYSFENGAKKLDRLLKKKIRSNKIAWDFFSSQPPSYQKTIVHWIMMAKQASTKLSRLDKLITESEQQKRIW